MTVGEVYDFIDSFAPFSIQDGFDNSGLLVGSREKQVKKLAVCLDITNAVVDECERTGTDLIVSHHPVIFTKIRSLDEKSPVYRLIRADIAAVCAHTSLDMAHGGISDMMFRLMGFAECADPFVLDMINTGSGTGYGRVARLSEETDAAQLARKAKEVFGCRMLRYVDGGKPIRTVAVSSGAGSDEVYNCIKKGIDAIITGDVKHHPFVDAKNAGLTVIDAGHYGTENIVCGVLAGRLTERFPDAEVFIPASNAEVCEYI